MYGNSVLSFIRRNLRKCHRNVKIDAYNYFVKPILDYSASIWTPHSLKYINKLKAIQKRAARFIMSDFHRTTSVSETLKNLKWKSIQTEHKELCLLMLYKIIYRLVELPLPDYIIPAPRVTRGNSMKLVHPPTNVDSYKYSFFPNSISVWNKLPEEIVNATSLNKFRTLLKSYL